MTHHAAWLCNRKGACRCGGGASRPQGATLRARPLRTHSIHSGSALEGVARILELVEGGVGVRGWGQ